MADNEIRGRGQKTSLSEKKIERKGKKKRNQLIKVIDTNKEKRRI